MTDLGREIPITDGRKPEWLADDEMIAPTYRVGRFASIEAGKATWLAIIAIRLRADHPFYKQEAVPGPMTRAEMDAIIADVRAKAKPVPSFDTDKYVLVERMTEEKAERWLAGKCLIGSGMGVLRYLGVIKPDPTPLERYMEQYPGDDRGIVERVMAWKG